jgi:hypothetical protein
MTGHSTPLTIADVIDCHARRDFGETGFREVTLTVFTKDQPSFSYEILHLWRVEQGLSCSSLYFLTKPPVLRGTAVKIVERPYARDIDVWLRLPTAEQSIHVDSSRCDQMLLGTDFSYSDLRFWLPTDSLDINSLEFKGPPGKQECSLKALRGFRGVDPLEIRLILDGNQWLPLTIEWLDSAGASRRIYSATGLVCVDGIWSPQVIAVSQPREQHRSVMSLRRALHRFPISPDLFLTEGLTQLTESVFEEWSVRAHELVELDSPRESDYT